MRADAHMQRMQCGFLRVPAEHAKNWRKHCQKYNACDQRVPFIEETWYDKAYAQELRKAGEKP